MTKKDISLKKLPPHSDEAEKSVLGAILLENEYLLKVMQVIEPADFYQPAHQKIFKVMKSMELRGMKIDLLLLSNEMLSFGHLEMVGGPPYLMDLLEATPTATTALHHAGLVKEKSVLRKLIAISTQANLGAYSETGGVVKLLDDTEKALFDLRSSIADDSRDWEKLEDTLSDVYEDISTACNPGNDITEIQKTIIPTGFKALDSLIVGLSESDMIVLAGRPSMGKTAYAFGIGGNVAKTGLPVAIFSVETARKPAAMRFLCTEAKVDSVNVKKGRLDDGEWSKLSNGMAVLNDIPLYLCDCPGLTLQDFRFKAKKVVEEHGARLIVIDYLQLMTIKGMRGNRAEEVTMLSRGIKAVARELGVPIIALSQLSRKVDDRKPPRPILSDLRESGAIEQDADVVIFLYRHAYYVKKVTEGGGVDLSTEVIIAKNRNGRIGTKRQVFIPKYTRFEEMEREHDNATN